MNSRNQICYICNESFEDKSIKEKKYCKVKEHCHYTWEYRGAAHSICNLGYSVPKEITIVFQNGSNYDYHFIMKQVAGEFEKPFTWLGENTEQHVTFPVPMDEEVIIIDRSRKEIRKNISYRL